MGKKLVAIVAGVALLLAAGVTAYQVPKVKNWVDGWGSSITNPSSEGSSELPSTEAYNIGDHPAHIFRAVDSTLILTATVTPADATDKTIIWTSSDSTSVAIQSTTATTATIKCLKTFETSVIITARATNGTTTEADDFTATCTCTFYHALESIDLQLIEVEEQSEITDLTDMPITEGGAIYRFKVVITPSYATHQAYTITNTGGEGVSGFSWEDVGPLDTVTTFVFDSFFDATLPDYPYTFHVASEDGIHSDNLTLSIGNHYSSSNKSAFTPTINAGGTAYTVAELTDRFIWGGDVQNPMPLGTAVTLGFAQSNYVSPTLKLTYDAAIFSVTSVSANGVDNQDGTITLNVDAGAVTVVLTSIASTGDNVASYVSIVPTNYANVTALSLPFAFSQPITGITLDHTSTQF